MPSAAKSSAVNTVVAGVPLVNAAVSDAEVNAVLAGAAALSAVSADTVVSAAASGGDVFAVVAVVDVAASLVVPGAEMLDDSDSVAHPASTSPTPSAEAPAPSNCRRVMFVLMRCTVPT